MGAADPQAPNTPVRQSLAGSSMKGTPQGLPPKHRSSAPGNQAGKPELRPSAPAPSCPPLPSANVISAPQNFVAAKPASHSNSGQLERLPSVEHSSSNGVSVPMSGASRPTSAAVNGNACSTAGAVAGGGGRRGHGL